MSTRFGQITLYTRIETGLIKQNRYTQTQSQKCLYMLFWLKYYKTKSCIQWLNPLYTALVNKLVTYSKNYTKRQLQTQLSLALCLGLK